MKKMFILLLLAMLLLIPSCMEKRYNPPGFHEFLAEARQEYPYLKSIKITNLGRSGFCCEVSLKETLTYAEIQSLAASIKNYFERPEVAEWLASGKYLPTNLIYITIEGIVNYDRSPMTDDYEFVWREFIY